MFMKVEGKPMFDENGKFVMGKFENIVSNVKEIALEAIKVPELENEIKSLKRALNNVKDVEIIKDTSYVHRNGIKIIDRKSEELESHNVGFYGVTRNKNKEQFEIVLNYPKPENGKKTSMHRNRKTIVEAIIARNEMAATLLKEGLIDFEKFLKFTQN